MKTFCKLFFLSIALINTCNSQVWDSIVVGEGWNMIGALSDGVVLELIRAEPSDIIVSQFYGYNPGGGYQAKDTLEKGAGYWVKVKSDGKIIFGLAGPSSCPGTPTVNYEGKIYSTVQIGNQCWLKENLNVGTRINCTQEQTDNGTIEKYCYGDDPSFCDTHGALYQWNEAMQYMIAMGGRGLCPPGWHIPTKLEFQILSTAVGGDNTALKAIGQGTGMGAGTNTSGFSALLSGMLSYDSYLNMSYDASIWSSEEHGLSNAYIMYLYHDDPTIFLIDFLKTNAASVRCIKN